mgnify:CR=1 FL=1
MSNNSDVLNFLEDVQNTVNIYNVRNALEAVSNAVSDLTKNFHLKASIFTDVSLSVISLLNVFDYVDDYNEAKLIGDESKKNAAFGQITSQFMDILGTAIGYVPGCKYTSLVLYVASDCLEAGTNIISKHIEQIREVERQIDEALGNKEPVNNWEELEQQLRDAGASESDIKALIDALKKLDDALSGSGVDTGLCTIMLQLWKTCGMILKMVRKLHTKMLMMQHKSIEILSMKTAIILIPIKMPVMGWVVLQAILAMPKAQELIP